MQALTRTYAVSPLRRRELAATRRALSAPMIGIPMMGDPYIGTRDTAGASLMERRACQYGAAMARRSGALPADLSALHAVYDSTDWKVRFVTAGDEPKVYATFAIPERIMIFEPDMTMLCLPAPAPAAPEAARCELTAPMKFEAPAPQIAASEARKPTAPPSDESARWADDGGPADDGWRRRLTPRKRRTARKPWTPFQPKPRAVPPGILAAIARRAESTFKPYRAAP